MVAPEVVDLIRTACVEPYLAVDGENVGVAARVNKVYFFLVGFFFNDTATTEIYTLSLHDALPIFVLTWSYPTVEAASKALPPTSLRSEEHTSELQSPVHLVCRLLLEKKKKKQ